MFLSCLLIFISLESLVVDGFVGHSRDSYACHHVSYTETTLLAATPTPMLEESEKKTPQLALLTFDLDDTLFPIGPVVQDANNAMIRAMHRLGYTKSTNKGVLKHTSAIRKKTKYPISYTSLRMRAIQAELESQLPKKHTVDPSVVKHCFDAWLNQRHASANDKLFPGVVETLERISAQHPCACIGAITNGRGNPKNMQSISHFFDFCVSGEDDGVFPQRKPQRGIYEASLARYKESYPHSIGDSRIWCHVGDCLANDVGASVDCGAHGVWMEADHEDVVCASSDKPPVWSTASKRTMENRERLKRAAKNKVSAKITRLSQLPNAIDALLAKAAQERQETVTR
jgi:putative hydrolase of the HAD superfamily